MTARTEIDTSLLPHIGNWRKSKTFPLTQLGNAETLAAHYADRVRYCASWKTWLFWDGRRWSRNNSAALIMTMATKVVRRIAEDAKNQSDEERQTEIRKFARRSETNYNLKAMIELAQSVGAIPVLPGDFDRNPMLLNCFNGTIDLETGKLNPHRREDLLTKLAPVPYIPGAKADVWLAFLNRILGGDQAMISFLQQAIGYSLTGRVSEKAAFFLVGSGNNGKTTMVETIRKMLGDYAGVMDVDTLMSKAQTGEKERATADLLGKRFVVSSEAAQGHALNEQRLKTLTGMSRLIGRRIYEGAFEFDPQFKIFMDANHKPVIRGTEDAIWYRIRLIPFNVSIPEAEQDKQLGAKLESELPGILAWAVEGCLEWQKQGRLIVPSSVAAANAGYRQEMDLVADFIADRCLEKPGATEASADLYDAFRGWCTANHEPPITNTAFGSSLTKKGYPQVRTSVARGRKGLELRRESITTLTDTVYLPTV